MPIHPKGEYAYSRSKHGLQNSLAMARDRAPPVQDGIRGSAFLRGCRYILIFRGLWCHASTSYNTVWSDIPKRRVSVLSVWTRMGQNSSIWCMTRCMCARARCKLGAMRASVPQPPFVHTLFRLMANYNTKFSTIDSNEF